MNKVNVALFFAALMVIGACAEPRKLLATTEGRELVEAEEHQRILAELEEVHQLRERMLQAGTHPRCSVSLMFASCCCTRSLNMLITRVCVHKACLHRFFIQPSTCKSFKQFALNCSEGKSVSKPC